MRTGKRQSGYTYLGVLLAVALLGIALAGVSEIWVKTRQRQKMVQMQWVMEQYRKAIESYYYSNTGSVHFYPRSIKNLLEDERHLTVKRHLRKSYENPFTQSADWIFITMHDGGITGIQTREPLADHETHKVLFIPQNDKLKAD